MSLLFGGSCDAEVSAAFKDGSGFADPLLNIEEVLISMLSICLSSLWLVIKAS